MINLNEEIDLVLAESLYEVLAEQDPQDGAFTWDDRPKRKKEPETPSPEPEEDEEAKKEEAKKAFEIAANDPKAREIAEAAKFAGKLFADVDADNPIYRTLGAVLANPTYDKVSTWITGLPSKGDIGGIVWFMRKWTRLPGPVRVALGAIPQIKPVIMAIEGFGDNIDKIGSNLLKAAGEPEVKPPLALRWLGFKGEDIVKLADSRPLTKAEEDALLDTQNEAIALLTKRTILLGPRFYNNMSTINKVAQVVRKYFIAKTALRESDAPTPKPTATETGSSSDTADLLRQLSRKVVISPAEAAKNLESLKGRVKPDVIESKWNKIKDKTRRDQQYEITYSLIRDAAYGKLTESTILKEDKMVELVIDFNELREKRLDESFLTMFGGWVEHLLKAMFGGWTPPVSIRGTQSDVRAFASALGGEKNYIEAVGRYGLDHPATYKSRAKLDNAIKGFERDTGLKWPFK